MKRHLLALATLAALSMPACRQQAVWLPEPNPKWAALPITVRWEGIEPVFDGSLNYAMAAWNKAAGCDVLRAAADARVLVTTYDGTACGAPASLETFPGAQAGTWRCTVDHAEVKFQTMSDIRSVYVTAAHEFGHVLGLDHDRSLIMRAAAPQYDPASGRNLDWLPWVSDVDGKAIGERYCR